MLLFSSGSLLLLAQITLRLYDYTGLDVAARLDTQREAGAALRQAGIDVQWRNCPSGICENADESAGYLLVALLPEKMSQKSAARPRQMGLAIAPDQARVFVRRVMDLARAEGVSWTRLLGMLVAHEIGHLLLGSSSHFPGGIMRGEWRSLEIRQALMGTLIFTPEQAARMQDDVRRRRRNRDLAGF
jgi:hypothetical protein